MNHTSVYLSILPLVDIWVVSGLSLLNDIALYFTVYILVEISIHFFEYVSRVEFLGHGKNAHLQFSSVTQSCPTLCDPMNHSTPGLPVHHNSQSLPKLMSVELVMPSNHLILCHPLLLPPSIFSSIRVI
ncbi:unnamed protein product [Rangifer tarandus platyrhynchus]|uniref:Uncharacterized protein n=1 Tax=Rangifer tarandus platyrhynchus TaxID=3082113 RepID=A0ABN9A6Z2_RANTA|nr:unnamed protein product [Rangifer tarandus platyrhynchus]